MALVPSKLAEAIWTSRPEQINRHGLPSAVSETYQYCCGALCIQISREVYQIYLGLPSVKTLTTLLGSISQTGKNTVLKKFLAFLKFLLQCFRAGLKIIGLQKTQWWGLKVKSILMKCPWWADLAIVSLVHLWNESVLYIAFYVVVRLCCQHRPKLALDPKLLCPNSLNPSQCQSSFLLLRSAGEQ